MAMTTMSGCHLVSDVVYSSMKARQQCLTRPRSYNNCDKNNSIKYKDMDNEEQHFGTTVITRDNINSEDDENDRDSKAIGSNAAYKMSSDDDEGKQLC